MNETTPKKKRPIILTLAAILVAFCCFCFIASAGMDALGLLPTSTPSMIPSASPIPTQTVQLPPTATLEPISQIRELVRESLGEGNRDMPRLTELSWDEAARVLNIKFAINDNFTSDFIMVGMQTDVTNILQLIAQSGSMPEYTMIVFEGTFSLRDNFGNVFEDTVLVAQYNKTTIDKINWDGFLYTDVFAIADGFRLHPAMTAP